jgi:hypothetical protein
MSDRELGIRGIPRHKQFHKSIAASDRARLVGAVAFERTVWRLANIAAKGKRSGCRICVPSARNTLGTRYMHPRRRHPMARHRQRPTRPRFEPQWYRECCSLLRDPYALPLHWRVLLAERANRHAAKRGLDRRWRSASASLAGTPRTNGSSARPARTAPNSHTKWRSGTDGVSGRRKLLYTIGDRTVTVWFDQTQGRRGVGKDPRLVCPHHARLDAV